MLTQDELELILDILEDEQRKEDYTQAYTENQRKTIDTIVERFSKD